MSYSQLSDTTTNKVAITMNEFTDSLKEWLDEYEDVLTQTEKDTIKASVLAMGKLLKVIFSQSQYLDTLYELMTNDTPQKFQQERYGFFSGLSMGEWMAAMGIDNE
jgi:hypothetical protein